MRMRKPIRFRWPFGERGQGNRKNSCYIEPIDVFCTLTAKHCGDHTADCSNGVLIGGGNVDIKIFGNKNPSGRGQGGVIFDAEGIVGALNVANSTPPNIAVRAVLTPDREEKRQNGRRIKDDGEPMFTLTAQDRHGVAAGGYNDVRIRRLTPRECWRLQGFPDEYFDKAAAVISDTQLYRTAGNAVSVPVAKAIGLRLKEIEQCEDINSLTTTD